ncbi:penicillin-binding transpeptidase domain-containing protein [Paenibacillus sp. Marseille-Q4541]|uniref:peptidoglycan D,D-transpeptidase FtsI family protein n=1 Tax=Paenibacillus sp. Marseille-Q4541 TaxID=2831522 RepID=UPI001BA5B652|nr:penicillin-binding transpeptidase domain-containing protein [Paenibacillus sp. Marseille-Q4541]
MSKEAIDPYMEQEIAKEKSFTFRLNIFFLATFLIFGVLIVRLAYLQLVQGPTLKKEEASIATKSVSIPPIRGTIFDSTGENRIAYSTSTQSLYMSLDKNYTLEENKAELKELISNIKKVFDQYGDPEKAMTEQEIETALDISYRKNYGYTPRRIKTDLTDKEIAYFLAHKDEFPNVEVVEENIRHYDEDTVAVQTVGYMKPFSSVIDPDYGLEYYLKAKEEKDPTLQYLDQEEVGYDGVELMFQEELRGTKGLKTFPVNSQNQISGEAELTPPEKGNNVWLSINKEVQLATEQAIMDQLEYLQTTSNPSVSAPNAKTGFAVAMEVDTGQIVAMASMPDYDSNVWTEGSKSQEEIDAIAPFSSNGTIREVYQSYGNKEESYKHPSSTVLLGSVIKPLSVLIGLQEDLFTTSTLYNDQGVGKFGKKGYESSVRNSGNHSYGLIDPASAIEHSSNAFMVEMVGNKLYEKYGAEGVDVWDRYMKEFGLGVSTESGLPNEQSGLREYVNEAKNSSSQSALAYASFGQQGKYTTLQLAQYTAMLANEGKRLKPQIASKITDVEGNVVKEFGAEILNTVEFDSTFWDEIKSGMNSNAQGFEGFPYDYARKTGTSEQSVGGVTVENGVFITFAPRDNPKLAIAVVVPEGKFGSNSAAPIARKIYDAYDQYIGLDGTPKLEKSQDQSETSE